MDVIGCDDAFEHVATTCLTAKPPGTVGVELEWFVHDERDPYAAVDPGRVAAALPAEAELAGRLTREPGGQVELSSAAAPTLADCVASASADLGRLRARLGDAGLRLAGGGTDPCRAPVRVGEAPRYVAMETYFDRAGPHGRTMMCGTASVQVCLDAGLRGDGPAGMARRWRVAHAVGPVLVGAFASSPRHAGVPTGWKSTRQAVWNRLDRRRTAPPAPPPDGADPAEAWARYALDAPVMCVRGPGPWEVPRGLTLRDWLSGAGPRPATRDDVDYHLTTLFPPVRPRGWLELRMIDAQHGDDGWLVPLAVATALLDDPAAAETALEATEAWDAFQPEPWRRAAALGLDDPGLARAAAACFAAALGALARMDAPREVRAAVERFTDVYVSRGRCPADEIRDPIGTEAGT
ncbi:glutamate--cysteine ligase EgtA [Planotetraspora thailandica]|uniref:Glutamate--cysteine ligase EgtA n=1 Tax=Planotetraspora thailandica TaxID=487172 RepID=A0A8J3V8E2_9ACTN|nr:ergothioneine biosynthesis glutamate--cysteine ligase EgtA [Planotetraspora thailandica]GII56791.1 glutamate--cysteine ligase EgtA [Planotetraspora thailandica]